MAVVFDLFAGIGGLSAGFRDRGLEVHAFEKDRACCDALAANGHVVHRVKLAPDTPFPDVPVLGIVGGPPCQPFSTAGCTEPKGGDDPRNGLPAFAAAVARCAPAFFVMENVPALASARHAPVLDAALAPLHALGYTTVRKLVDMSFYGVPQRRKRLFVVGFMDAAAARRFAWPEPDLRPTTVGDALPPSAWDDDSDPALRLDQKWWMRTRVYEVNSGVKTPRDLRPDDPARTLTTRNLCERTNDAIRLLLADGRTRRRLSVPEIMALQGIDRGFDWAGASRWQICRMAGNSVPMPWSRRLAPCVLAAIRTESRANHHR